MTMEMTMMTKTMTTNTTTTETTKAKTTTTKKIIKCLSPYLTTDFFWYLIQLSANGQLQNFGNFDTTYQSNFFSYDQHNFFQAIVEG